MVRCLLYTVLGLFLFLGMELGAVQAQTAHNHAVCGVSSAESEAIKQRMLANRRNRAELLAQFESGRSGNNTVYVPIQFFIVNKNDGTGGETHKDILDNLCLLNSDYRSIGVQFYLNGPIRVINQDLLYTNNRTNTIANYFMTLYRVNGVVNVFVGDEISNFQSGGTTLGYYDPAFDFVYCIRQSVNGFSSTLTHELGHFLGLPHTFSGWERQAYSAVADGDPTTLGVIENTVGRTPSFLPGGARVELLVRSGGDENCQIAGDGFCDTDANYLFGFYRNRYNNGCEYASTAMDPNGFLFRPDIIAPEPTRILFDEDSDVLNELWLRNLSVKDRIFNRTLVVVEGQYTLNGNTVTMWSDTLGNTDSTEVSANRNADKNIIGRSGGQTDLGYITMGGHYFDINVSAPAAPALVFDAAPAEYSILNSSNTHRVDMDSLRVTNPASSGAVVTAGTNVVVTDIFANANGQISSVDNNYPLPNDLNPGESYTFDAVTLRRDDTQIAGVVVNYNMYAPYRDTSGTTSENIMSYYDDACVSRFSDEQGDAMKQDIASRGFATRYPTPPLIDINTRVTVRHPVDNSIAPQPLVHFAWDAVNGATMYEVVIYQINAVGGPLVGGDRYERMVTGTDLWLDIVPNQRYKWTVFPINATKFCDRNTLQSSQATFEVFDWGIGVNNIKGQAISSTIYPNPAAQNSQVVLDINAKDYSEARITMFNSVGQSLMPAQVLDLVPGNNIQKLNTGDLPAGLYIINVETKGGVESHKLTITE